MIDWGDNRGTSLIKAVGTEWVGASHSYPRKCMKEGGSFDIIISSSEDNIIGISVGSGEMDVENVNISGCQSLQYFRASWRSKHFDLTTNPGIRKIEICGNACHIADFSNSRELRELKIQYGDESHKLNLSKCDNLEYLSLCHTGITDIAISNRSALKQLEYEETPINEKSLEILRRVIERNGGEIRKLETDNYSID